MSGDYKGSREVPRRGGICTGGETYHAWFESVYNIVLAKHFGLKWEGELCIQPSETIESKLDLHR
ncbi:hypothetical protein J2Z66_000483 [Paenibacillus eucommiae]|uniref:Uncharacterized protein n=1 Tax=Paenibacillus eucommiae TaxID=1355755 RepID=A0ABS4IMZ4_9BACL|nr:hypothetical protein [Paenibacillus eucommiae]